MYPYTSTEKRKPKGSQTSFLAKQDPFLWEGFMFSSGMFINFFYSVGDFLDHSDFFQTVF